LPLHLFDDARIGDAVYRLMYDTPSITQTCYRILLVPTLVPFAIAPTRSRSGTASTSRGSRSRRSRSRRSRSSRPGRSRAAAPPGRAQPRGGPVSTTSLEGGSREHPGRADAGRRARERARFDRDSARSFAQHRGVMALAMLAILPRSCGIALVRWVFLEIVDLVISGAISLGDFSVLFTYFVQIGVFAVMFGSLWFALQTAAPGSSACSS
jgi:hypothetical protein